jgi:hypothetical protein
MSYVLKYKTRMTVTVLDVEVPVIGVLGTFDTLEEAKNTMISFSGGFPALIGHNQFFIEELVDKPNDL